VDNLWIGCLLPVNLDGQVHESAGQSPRDRGMTVQLLWDEAVGRLKSRVSSQNYDMWLRPDRGPIL